MKFNALLTNAVIFHNALDVGFTPLRGQGPAAIGFGQAA